MIICLLVSLLSRRESTVFVFTDADMIFFCLFFFSLTLGLSRKESTNLVFTDADMIFFCLFFFH